MVAKRINGGGDVVVGRARVTSERVGGRRWRIRTRARTRRGTVGSRDDSMYIAPGVSIRRLFGRDDRPVDGRILITL